MKKEPLRISQNSKLPIITMVCAGLILLLKFVTINIIQGEFHFVFRFPIHVEGSLIDILESSIALCIPLLLLIFSILFSKKNLKMLCWPLVLYEILILYRTGYYSMYAGSLTLRYTWLDFVMYGVLLAAFALTVYGKIGTKWWVTAVALFLCAVAVSMLFVNSASYSFVVGESIYLSEFVSFITFFASYAALGFALDKKTRSYTKVRKLAT